MCGNLEDQEDIWDGEGETVKDKVTKNGSRPFFMFYGTFCKPYMTESL